MTLLLATDGSATALGALRVARKMEQRHGWRIRVMSVVEPLPVFDTGFGATLPEAQIYETRRSELRQKVTAQIREVRGSASAWDLTIADGVPASRIVDRAREVDARVIVLGLGRHGLVERFLGTETALRVVRIAHRPVLAVPAEVRELGHRLVAAVDFSAFSERAVRAALPFLKPPGEVHLVHVLSGLEGIQVQEESWRQEYRDDAEERLDRLRRHLDLPDGWSCRSTVLTGRAEDEIPAHGDEIEADLLAAGSHGHSFVGRLILGSVSTRLLRTAERSVLLAPPVEPVSGEAAATTEREREWTRTLRAFSRRNEGRRTVLELDDPEIGAQHSGRGYRLGGVEYEPDGNRIVIVLGRGVGSRDHLTHSLSVPRSIEIVEDDEGGEALRIALERGQVILRIASPSPSGPGGEG